MMYSTHLAWIKDKNCMAKKSAYTRAKQKAQSMLHEMKSRRWINKAAELQEAADQHDLISVMMISMISPSSAGCLRSTSGWLSTCQITGWPNSDHSAILELWEAHFKSVLNQQSTHS